MKAPPGIAAAHGADYYDKRFKTVSIFRRAFDLGQVGAVRMTEPPPPGEPFTPGP
jgi:hypothetical protein